MQQVFRHGWHQAAGSICDFNSENTVFSCWQNNNIIKVLQCPGIWITWHCWKPITFNSASLHNFRVYKLSNAEPTEIQNLYFASTVIIFDSITIACVKICEPGCPTSTLLHSLGIDKWPYFYGVLLMNTYSTQQHSYCLSERSDRLYSPPSLLLIDIGCSFPGYKSAGNINDALHSPQSSVESCPLTYIPPRRV